MESQKITMKMIEEDGSFRYNPRDVGQHLSFNSKRKSNRNQKSVALPTLKINFLQTKQLKSKFKKMKVEN